MGFDTQQELPLSQAGSLPGIKNNNKKMLTTSRVALKIVLNKMLKNGLVSTEF